MTSFHDRNIKLTSLLQFLSIFLLISFLPPSVLPLPLFNFFYVVLVTLFDKRLTSIRAVMYSIRVFRSSTVVRNSRITRPPWSALFRSFLLKFQLDKSIQTTSLAFTWCYISAPFVYMIYARCKWIDNLASVVCTRRRKSRFDETPTMWKKYLKNINKLESCAINKKTQAVCTGWTSKHYLFDYKQMLRDASWERILSIYFRLSAVLKKNITANAYIIFSRSPKRYINYNIRIT